jgi:hypothetical protein
LEYSLRTKLRSKEVLKVKALLLKENIRACEYILENMRAAKVVERPNAGICGPDPTPFLFYLPREA